MRVRGGPPFAPMPPTARAETYVVVGTVGGRGTPRPVECEHVPVAPPRALSDVAMMRMAPRHDAVGETLPTLVALGGSARFVGGGGCRVNEVVESSGVEGASYGVGGVCEAEP